MKQRLIVLFAFIFLFSALPGYVSASSDFDISNGKLIRYNGMASVVTIPNSVTSIGDDAFRGNSFINKVVIPDSVKTIGNFAFSDCPGLLYVNAGYETTSIGRGAFKNCRILREVVIPNKVTVIDDSAFENCISLTTLTLGTGIKTIGKRAFAMCTGLEEVTLYKNVTSIGECSFLGCVSLKNFVVASENATYTAIDGVIYSKDKSKLVAYPQARAGALTMPSGVSIIASGAFAHAINLTGIAPTNNLTIIGDSAFLGCVSLREIYLPKATKIDNYAFYGCQDLKTARIGGADIGENAFSKCESLGIVIIGNGAKTIARGAFDGSSSLKNIVIPASVSFIGGQNFSNPSNLKIFCDDGSVAKRYASEVAKISTAPIPKPSTWAAEAVSSADRFAIPALQLDYQGNATRYEFTMAAVNFVEQYYSKNIETLLKERELKPGTFSDTTDLDILAANGLGIVAGSDGKFNPDKLLTREEAAALTNNILVNVLKVELGEVPEASFGDSSSISPWAANAVNTISYKGVMSGDGVNFNPKQQYTREMCIITFSNLWKAVN